MESKHNEVKAVFGLEIKELTPKIAKKWDEYVLRSDKATFFHQLGWKRVLEKVFGYKPLYLAALRNGQVKGIFPLLNALHLAKQRIPKLHCVIGAGQYQQSNSLLARTARAVLSQIGSGTHSQRVAILMQRYEMHGYVHLLPFRTDVEQLIAASDLVVFPSTEPHFARPVIEAGAMAKPAVASRIGGVEELVVDGETGLLVPPGDAGALAEAIVKALRDADLARRLGEAGYQQARRRFDAESNTRQIQEVYERLLNARKQSSRGPFSGSVRGG